MIHQRIGRRYVIPLEEETETKRLTKLANDLGIKYLNNNNMLIKVISPKACEKIATLLRPSLRSVPKYIDIYPLGVHHGQVLMHWKNNAVTTVQIGIAQLNICKDSIEIVFIRVTGKEPYCRYVSEKPVIIPIEYE